MISKPVKGLSIIENLSYSSGKRYLYLKDLEDLIYASFDNVANQILEDILRQVDDKSTRECLKRYLRERNETIPISVLEKLFQYDEADHLEPHVSF